MTTVAVESPAAGSLRPVLAREHANWMAEVGVALGPAQHSDAGPWARWNALRYFGADFAVRVAEERHLVASVTESLSESERTYLWALGELLEVLPEYLGHEVGLCHRPGEFAEVTTRIVIALDRWTRAVEEVLGPLPASTVPGTVLGDSVGASARDSGACDRGCRCSSSTR